MHINHGCLVCLGSNCQAEFHLKNVERELNRLFHMVRMGKIVITKAEGDVVQPDYMNQAVSFSTDLPVEEVEILLKQIEKDNGRTADDKLKGTVPLDIDLLKYDEVVLRPGDLKKDYVKQAIAELL